MTIQSIIANNSVKLLSGLANNSDSIMPMAVKDTISNGAIVYTYKKEGGKDDAREKAIEEFGTGAVWLFGIPAVKKLINKTIYPLFGLKAELDPRLIDKNNVEQSKELIKGTTNELLKEQKHVFETLNDNCKFLNKSTTPFTNAQMYKGLFVGKFAFATALSAFALSKIIKYKQKTTENRIKKDVFKNNASKILLTGAVKQNDVFNGFMQKKSKKEISFGSISNILAGGARDFMYNPIKNTAILDGVITGTRLHEARKGEKKEVFLKEAFQLLFIYGLAKPIQMGFEAIGKALKAPIELDPSVIFDKNVIQKISDSKKDIKMLKQSKDILKDIYSLDPKSTLVELLSKNGSISTIKNANGEIGAISHFNFIKQDDVKKALSHLEALGEASNIKKVKALKTFAVLGNVAIAAWAMGVLQPKVAIWMRKKLNNGDNRNPAIVAQEKAILNAQKN